MCSDIFRLMNDFLDEIENRSQTAVIEFFKHFVDDYFTAFEHAADANSGHAQHHVTGSETSKRLQKKEIQTCVGQFHDQVVEFVDRLFVGFATLT